MRVTIVLALLTVLLAAPAAAQQSASYKLKESVFDAGGRPAQGVIATSPSYRVRLDAIGEAAARTGAGSASYHVDSGFLSAYPPPHEAADLVFRTRTTMTWRADPSAGVYNLYRDPVSALPGQYGTCYRASIPEPKWDDTDLPPAGAGLFYLVTVKNRLWEEGTKGHRSDGIERTNAFPCP